MWMFIGRKMPNTGRTSDADASRYCSTPVRLEQKSSVDVRRARRMEFSITGVAGLR